MQGANWATIVKSSPCTYIYQPPNTDRGRGEEGGVGENGGGGEKGGGEEPVFNEKPGQEDEGPWLVNLLSGLCSPYFRPVFSFQYFRQIYCS